MDLSEKIGLNVKLNEQNRLEFDDEIVFDGESIRSMKDLAVVASDENIELDDSPAYFMYRNVHVPQDEETITTNNQRFDLTVIPANKLGREFIKTSGHYHPKKPGTDVEYPELYYVISGQATYLMQKHEADGSISNVIISRVKPGQAIIMPLGYGHVTINELDEPLVMANWVERNFKSDYGDFETKRGAAYYLNSDGSIVNNPRYENVPEVRMMESNPQKIAELAGTPIYDYVKSLDKIELIAKPEGYLDDYKIEKLFR
jgi:glucose-6-phosphate isomerase